MLARVRTGVRHEIGDILTRALKGDKDAAAIFLAVVDRMGAKADGTGYYTFLGDVARLAEDATIRGVIGDKPVRVKMTCRKLDEVRAALEGPAPDAVEKLLARRAAADWLHLHGCELAFGNPAGRSIREAEFQERRIDRANRRYLRTLKTLAQIRRHATPAPTPTVNVNQAINLRIQASAPGRAPVEPESPGGPSIVAAAGGLAGLLDGRGAGRN